MCSIRWAGWAIFAPAACASSATPRRASARTSCASYASIASTRITGAAPPLPTLRMMAEDAVLAPLLPEARRLGRLAALVPLEPAPDALRRLGALLDSDAGAAAAVAERLRLSNEQRERLVALAAPSSTVDLAGDERAQRRALHRLGADLYRDLVLLCAAESGNAARARDLLALAAGWQPREFPLKGRDVTARGVAEGPEVGRLLAAVEAWWEDGDFRADRKAALAELKRRVGKA